MDRITNEINHGKYISENGEEIWNWSSPAGIIRWKRRINLFISEIGSNNSILEIGCGTGLFTKEIQNTTNNITAIDISPDLVEIAKTRVLNKNVKFIVENAYKTSFQNNSFDYIIGSSVLHHLEIDEALKEFNRILKPGGKILFTEPNMLNPQIAIQKNIPFIKKWAGDSPDETAFIRFKLVKQIKKTGFRNAKITPFDFLHPSIPSFILKPAIHITTLFERIPLIKEISGSLIILAQK